MSIVPSQGLKHVAVIMDGNGRWATERGLSRSEGHQKGYEVFRDLVRHVVTLGIPEFTCFALSSENLARPAQELGCLMKLFLRAAQHDMALLDQQHIEVKIVGDLARLAYPVQIAAKKLNQRTLAQPRMQMNICFAYGGQWHIEHAFLNCQKENASLESFRQHLMAPFRAPMDLVIRTGGVSRISNFALWPLAYAELSFIDVYWPDMTTALFDQCIEDFKRRQRRFGQIT